MHIEMKNRALDMSSNPLFRSLYSWVHESSGRRIAFLAMGQLIVLALPYFLLMFVSPEGDAGQGYALLSLGFWLAGFILVYKIAGPKIDKFESRNGD